MRRCFIGFLIGYFRNTLNIPQFRGVSQESGELLGGVSDCEELVGVTHGDDGGVIHCE